MIKHWDELKFWQLGDWQAVQERLEDMEKAGKYYNPARENLFAALDATPFEQVKVAIIAQDPYPKSQHATGIAFSVPKTCKRESWPPTLVNLFKEYTNDLGHPEPASGCLDRWAAAGVLLWNATPSCETNKPGSHRDWVEWPMLTREIVEELNKNCVVFALLGNRARALRDIIKTEWSPIIEASHPSPLSEDKTTHPFKGSRLFSTINDKLKGDSIDWRL